MIRTSACAITGHRPTRFRFKYDENNNGCKRIKKRIRDQLIQLYEQGFRQFWVGGALGVDMWAGEILLRLKEQPEYSEIQLKIALPFEGHDTDWEDRSRSRMSFLIRHSVKKRPRRSITGDATSIWWTVQAAYWRSMTTTVLSAAERA